MDVRQVMKRCAGGPKQWLWAAVAVVVVFTVSRALSQPAIRPADKTPELRTEPLPTAETKGDEPVFRAYQSPDSDTEGAARKLQNEFSRDKEVRVAADARTGKILVVAPPSVHRQLANRLTSADEPAAATKEGAVVARAKKSLTLKNTQARDFEAALGGLAGRQLPVAVERDGQLATYTLTSKSDLRVTMTVDRKTGEVAFDGPADLVAGWVRVAGALDSPRQSKTEASRVVPIRNSNPIARGAIQRALSFVGEQVNETTVEGQARLVSMRFQPRAGAQAQPGQVEQNAQPPAVQPLAQPLAQPQQAPEEDASAGLTGPVQIEFLEGLDQIVIRGNPRDVERVIQIIRDIEQQAIETAPSIEIYYLKHVNSEAMAALVTTLYDQVFSARQGRVNITPLVKPNALLLIGRDESVRAVLDLIRRLDQPVAAETQFQVFPLRHTSANEAETTIREYLGIPPTTGVAAPAQAAGPGLSSRALVIGDFRTNSLIVRASPRDLVEIDELIKKIDVATSAAVNELRVFTLRNSLAEELAPVLQSAITGQQQRVGQQQQQGGFQQFQQQQQQQQQQPGQQRGQQLQNRSTMLQFLTIDPEGRRSLRSGILTDVRITADPTGNSLLVSAPADSMELIAALIAELDRVPTSTAQIKVFTIENGDAQSLVTMLQTLFGLQQTGARQQQGFLQQFVAPTTDGSPLVSLRFSVDSRTNSIIASGSAGDLAIVEAILERLDLSDVRERRSIVYRLKHAPALDVANSITQFLTSRRQLVQQQFGTQLVSPFEQIESEVVVVPEVVTNSLIISATPRFFDEVRTIVEELDRRPPMVAIQVLIAEVTLTNTDEFGVELGLQDSVLFERSLLEGIQLITETTTFGDPPTTVQSQEVITATNTPGFAFNNSPLGNSGSGDAIARSSTVGGQGITHFSVGRQNDELGFGGLVLSASSESVSFLLRALSESRRLDVLARPQVTTLENQTAFIQVGQRVPIVSNVTFTDFGQNNAVTLEDVGLIMLVTPRVTSEGLVVMDIRAERSEVGPEAEGVPISINVNGDVVRQPRINRTLAETTVSALNGQTLVLGGLIHKTKSETHRRVPLLSEIPILGHLFRYDNVQSRRTELLIIMTPRVLRTKEDADILKQVEAARMSWCLADVIKIHGESGLRGRNAEWTDAETTVIYPEVTPEMLKGIMPDGAEEIVTPPSSGRMITPPPTSPPPGIPPAAARGTSPPTIAPPTQPGGAAPMRIPLGQPTDPPPSLPYPGSGARVHRPAGPVVNGPTYVPVQPDAANRNLPTGGIQPVQNANFQTPVRGSAYGDPTRLPPQQTAQQALYQPPSGENRQAIHQLPIR